MTDSDTTPDTTEALQGESDLFAWSDMVAGAAMLLVEQRLVLPGSVALAWLVEAMLERRELHLTHPQAEAIASGIFARFEKCDGSDAEILLPGSKFMQIGYVIERDHKRLIVGVDHMTAAELMAIMDRLRAKAASASAEAAQLRAHVASRQD